MSTSSTVCLADQPGGVEMVNGETDRVQVLLPPASEQNDHMDRSDADEIVLARDALELRVQAPRAWRRLARWAAVVGSNLALEGDGARHPGGSTAVVVDPCTGRTVCEVRESMDDDGTSDFARLLTDFEQESLSKFLHRWATEG